jgi:hypothetical protein
MTPPGTSCVPAEAATPAQLVTLARSAGTPTVQAAARKIPARRTRAPICTNLSARPTARQRPAAAIRVSMTKAAPASSTRPVHRRRAACTAHVRWSVDTCNALVPRAGMARSARSAQSAGTTTEPAGARRIPACRIHAWTRTRRFARSACAAATLAGTTTGRADARRIPARRIRAWRRTKRARS